MIEIRKGSARGLASHEWLSSAHTFSFADYHDPKQMGFGVLRALNEDWVAPGRGFASHSHHDMEIISYVVEGSLSHKDSLGTGSTIRVGDIQRISAGSGLSHSEFNASGTEPVHFLQIWIEPREAGGQAEYAEGHFGDKLQGQLVPVVSPDGRKGSLTLNQDVVMYAGRFDASDSADLTIAAGRRAYVHVIRGQLDINGRSFAGGDGARVSGEMSLTLRIPKHAEVLVFDLA